MTYTLIIPGRLPGLNDYQLECRKSRWAGAKCKKDTVEIVKACIYEQLEGLKIEKPCEFTYRFFEPNKRRDKDNISSFGRKCIQDALVECGVLFNDGWNEIISYTDYFFIDRENPRIEVEIIEKEVL